uniref:Uncharacterized protein n=1 Tax=Cannabis sativa TaxID=3483 RepID=A0A803PFX0_CANSA
MFKACYYPRGSFLGAELGSNSSFIWRIIILKAQFFVQKMCQMVVGSGSNINILRNPWLLNKDDPFVISSHPNLSDQPISSLMVVGEKAWDSELIDDSFVEHDAKLILNIPLLLTVIEDGCFWSREG